MREDILVDSLLHVRVSRHRSLSDYRPAAGSHAAKPINAISGALYEFNEIGLHAFRANLTPRLNRGMLGRFEASKGHALTLRLGFCDAAPIRDDAECFQ